MSVDDHGLEVLKKSAVEIVPNDKSEYYIRVGIVAGALSVDFTDVIAKLQEILDAVDELEDFTDGLEAFASSILGAVDGLEGFTDGIEGLLTSILAATDQLEGFVDGLEGFVDGLEGLLGTSNSLLTDIKDNQTNETQVINMGIGHEFTGTSTANGAITFGATPYVDVSKHNFISVQPKGIWSATLNFQGTNDLGVTFWTGVPMIRLDSPTTAASASATWISADGPIFVAAVQYKYFRILVTGYSSGTIDIIGEAKYAPNTFLQTFAQAVQSGNWFMRLLDGSGNIITSQANGAQRAMDVGVNVAGVQIDPRSIRLLTSGDQITVVASALPTGAATEGKQDAGNASLSSIDGKLNSLGQKIMSTSVPVVLPLDQIPSQTSAQTFFLMNAGSKLMNVNGSVTPVNFDFTPASGAYYVEQISFFIQDTGTQGMADFGALAALTNGLLIKTKSNGIENDWQNLKDNIDLAMTFHEHAILLAAVSTGFLNSNDFFLGAFQFDNPITLKFSTSDFFRATVRDNLTGINNLRMLLYVRKAT